MSSSQPIAHCLSLSLPSIRSSGRLAARHCLGSRRSSLAGELDGPTDVRLLGAALATAVHCGGGTRVSAPLTRKTDARTLRDVKAGPATRVAVPGENAERGAVVAFWTQSFL